VTKKTTSKKPPGKRVARSTAHPRQALQQPLSPNTDRTAIQRERDQHEIMRLYLKGHSLRKIAQTLSERTGEDGYTLSVNQVRSDINRVREEWKKRECHQPA
jgi:hypothetical protein